MRPPPNPTRGTPEDRSAAARQRLEQEPPREERSPDSARDDNRGYRDDHSGYWMLGLLPVAGLLLVALVLRLLRVTTTPVDIDELGQVVAARMALDGTVAGIAGHYSPPLDYLVTAAGLWLEAESIWALRVPAALFGTAAVGLQYWLALTVTRSRATALTAAALLALAPIAINYSGWIRMYSLFLMLSTAYLLAFVRYDQTRSRGWLAAWIAAGVLALYTHYFAVFLIFASLLWLAGRAAWESGLRGALLGHRDLRVAVITGVVMGATLAPWLAITWLQAAASGGVLPWGHPTAVHLVGRVFLGLSGGAAPFDSLPALAAISLVYGAFMLAGLYHLWHTRRQLAMLFVVIGVAPMLILGAYITVVGPVTTTRNLIFMLPALLVPAAAGITFVIQRLAEATRARTPALSTFVQRQAAAVAVVVALGLALPGTVATVHDDRIGLGHMADYLTAHAATSDRVISWGMPDGFLEVVYDGDAPIVEVPPTVEDFEATLREAAGSPGGCLWIVWSGHDNPYWDVGLAPDEATAVERERGREVVSTALDEWAVLALEGTHMDHVSPATGVYQVCGQGIGR